MGGDAGQRACEQVRAAAGDGAEAVSRQARVGGGGTGSRAAARDGGFVWAPSDPLLERWLELYHQVCRRNGADADAGRHLLGWARAASFSDIQAGSSTWTFADSSTRSWWSDLWAERVICSALAEQAISYRLSTREELEAISSAWHRWAEHDDGFFVVVHAELIARR